MPEKTILISELIDKYIYSAPGINVNIREGANLQSKILSVAKGGSRIGKVYTWIQKEDGPWLQIYESYGKKPIISVETGKPIPGTDRPYVKFTKNILDANLRSLKQQGLKTEEEKEKEKKKKEEYEGLTWYEKIFKNTGDSIKKAFPYVLGAYVVVQSTKKK